MKLKMLSRSAKKTSEINKIRVEGHIPAIIYVKGKPSEPISISNAEYLAAMREVQQGRLPTTVLTLMDGKKERRVIIKDIQYHPTTYKVLHLDFEELHDDVKVKIKVPIECTGLVDCVGIKLGGILRQAIRTIRVRCLPRDIPTVFEVDVRNMALGESKRLSEIDIPKKVQPLVDLNEVAIVIGRR